MTCSCSLGNDRCDCGLCDYTPAGRPLVPGQNCAPHKGKSLLWAAVWIVSAAAAFVLVFVKPGA